MLTKEKENKEKMNVHMKKIVKKFDSAVKICI